jgi:hypothetical protein
MFDPSPYFRLGAVFRSLDLIHNTAVAVAAIDEIPGPRRLLPDHRPLAAVGLITPDPGLIAVQQIGQPVLSATLNNTTRRGCER